MECGVLFVPPENRPAREQSLIFLAGPIQGAVDWQSEATNLIWERLEQARGILGFDQEIDIASPRRGFFTKFSGAEAEKEYREQVEWEHKHLAIADVTLFWLAKEYKHNCDRAYAQTTRFELGEACALSHFDNRKIVVGIEPGFSNARYIRMTLQEKYPNIPILASLEETCGRAVYLALSQRA